MSNAVRDAIAKRRLASADDGEDQTPYDTLARAGATPMDEELPAQESPTPATSMDDYDEQEARLSQVRSAADESNRISNIGNALSHVALGTHDPTSMSDLYSNISSQNKDRVTQESASLGRRASVMKAIQAAKAKEIQSKVATDDRTAYRAQQQANNDRNFEQREREIGTRTAANSAKRDELKPAEAKQRGLYKMGVLAEQQYLDAVSDPKEYDPTRSGQLIDDDRTGLVPNLLKNDRAKEAHAAQSAWVEAFLRDASGAAIPPNERGAYAKDFFPQPGDTKAIVANKAELRKQKMANAQVASGDEGESVSHQAAARTSDLSDSAAHAAGSDITEQDLKALQWLKANPKDPAAAGVKAKLLRKGLH